MSHGIHNTGVAQAAAPKKRAWLMPSRLLSLAASRPFWFKSGSGLLKQTDQFQFNGQGSGLPDLAAMPPCWFKSQGARGLGLPKNLLPRFNGCEALDAKKVPGCHGLTFNQHGARPNRWKRQFQYIIPLWAPSF